MRISLALGNRDALDRQTARACAATNLGLPGFGSLMAGRAVGYAQAALTVAGFALTLICGLQFIMWFFANWSKINDPQADGFEMLRALWLAVRWTLLGMALFGVSWLWALATSFMVLRAAPKNEGAALPPKLN
jgi:hypothetical protein